MSATEQQTTEPRPAAPPHATATDPGSGGPGPTRRTGAGTSLRARFDLRSAYNREASWRPRWLWAAFVIPGAATLGLFFVVPFYAAIAVAAGPLNPVFLTPEPQWDPLRWQSGSFTYAWRELVGKVSFLGPPLGRTVLYTAMASLLCLLIGYPVAYFVARFARRRRGLYLLALLAPFWVSYMMRMLAWIDLLQTGGYVNRVLEWLHLMGAANPENWLDGKWFTVVLGLVYGYIPYLVVVLYAGLDRIDASYLEAARDLGLNKVQTFTRVTLRLSRPTILAGMMITVLPMIGDYYTNQLLSASPSTTMIGNAIEGQLGIGDLEGPGTALSVALLVLLIAPLIYYVRSTAKTSVDHG